MRTVTCDRCKTNAAANVGQRHTGKPADWIKVTVAGKTHNSVPSFSRGFDLCPSCAQLAEKFIQGAEK